MLLVAIGCRTRGGKPDKPRAIQREFLGHLESSVPRTTVSAHAYYVSCANACAHVTADPVADDATDAAAHAGSVSIMG